MPGVRTPSRLTNRNIITESGRSSMRLEAELWEALWDICRRENIAMTDLVRKVDGAREGRQSYQRDPGVRFCLFPPSRH